MANNGVYYSSAHTLNFTTTGTTWATLTSGGTFLMNAVSATTYYNLPVSGLTGGSNISVTGSNGNYTISYTGTSGTSGDYLPLSGGTVTGATIFQSGLTANTFYTNYIDFNTSSTPVNNEGRLIWNNADEIGGLEVTMMSGNTVLQIGEENLARVYNDDSVTLTAGTVVYVFGSQGNTISVKRASSTGETTSSRALGVVSESIAVGERGFVNTFGLVKGLNTLAYSGGTPIWLGTTPGSWTSTEPDAPNHTVLIGFISRSANSPNGSLFVHISNGWELNELHNVYAPSPSDGNVLKYSAATSVWVNSNTINLNGVSASTISATTYQNLPQSVSGGGTSNYISKWTGSTGLGDSQIVDDGSQVYIGANGVLNSLFSVVGPVGVNEFQIQAISSSLGITDSDLTTWTTAGGEIAIGGGSPLASSSGSGNVSIGFQSMQNNSTGVDNVAVGRRSLSSNQAGQANVAIGYRAGGSVDSGSYNVFIGYDAGLDVTTEDNRLYIANNTYGTLIYGEFDNQIVNINGTLSATTYDNLPGSSSANCFTTFYVTNISGCSPVNVLSPLNVKDGLSVTGTSTFINQANFTGGISASTFSASTYQNLPSFNSVQINGTTQFSGDTNNYINFSGINITITSAATNTLVFSAGTGGGGGISGGGTTNYIPKFTGSTGIGNSQLQDNGSQVFTNQGYGAPLIGNLSINASGTTGIAGRATQYGVYGTISGFTANASAVYGEAGKGQYGVYGYNIGDTAGEYVGVYGYATEASSAVGGTVYIGGRFQGFNGTGAGYSVQLQDGTEGTNKVLVSQTSDGKANWNTLQGVGITITSAATNTLVFSSPIVTLWRDVTLYSSNVAANTLVASKLVPANTFQLGDLFEITSSFSGNSINGQSMSVRLYINTSASLTGAQLLGTFTNSTATNQYTGFYRHGFFTAVGSSGNLNIVNTALALATSITNSNTSSTQVTINTTVDQYLIFAIQVASTTYTHQIRGISAKITR